MRISLQLAREPFAAIIRATLEPFLLEFSGQTQTVAWQSRRVGVLSGGRGQAWLANPLINAIFSPDAGPEVLAAPRVEYRRASSSLRRFPQRLYVEAATRRPINRLLAPCRMYLDPGLEQAAELLIMGGNHRFRLNWPRNNLCYVIPKSGFPLRFFHNELQGREAALASGLPVPPIVEVSPSQRWYAEPYLAGTPHNRLQDLELRRKVLGMAQGALARLGQNSLQSHTARDYADQTRERIDQILSGQRQWPRSWAVRLGAIADSLHRAASSSGGEVYTCRTHGDFQPGNLLWDQGRLWIIDWEYSWRRHICYDSLTWLLSARSAGALGRAALQWMERGTTDEGGSGWAWLGPAPSAARERRDYVAWFALEEMILRLQEVAGCPYPRHEEIIGGNIAQLALIAQTLENLR